MVLLRWMKIIINHFVAGRFYDQAAQMAYYLMLSLFPFLIFLFTLIGYLNIDPASILEMIEPFAPHDTFVLVQKTLESILNNKHGKLLSFSLVSAFWLASMAIQSLVRSLNQAYNIKREPSFFLQGILSDLILTFGFMVILSFSLLVPLIEDFVTDNILASITIDVLWYRLWFITKWGVGTLFLFLFFMLLYKIVPSIRITFTEALPGALFTTIGWQIVSIIFRKFANLGNYTALYGQLGSIIALLVWFYFTATVLLLGGIMNAFMYHKGKNRPS